MSKRRHSYQRLCWLTYWGIPEFGAMLIEGGVEDLRHASSGEIARGLFGEGASGVGPASKDVNQSRRLLSLAAVRDGMDRGSAAKIGGMDRQTLRDWVHRFNGSGPQGLIDNWTEGPKPRLSAEQLAQFAQIVEAGRSVRRTGSCAGGGSTSSGSSPRGSASRSTNAMSGSCCRNSASRT